MPGNRTRATLVEGEPSHWPVRQQCSPQRKAVPYGCSIWLERRLSTKRPPYLLRLNLDTASRLWLDDLSILSGLIRPDKFRGVISSNSQRTRTLRRLLSNAAKHINLPWVLASLKATSSGDPTVIATIQVARMKNGHSFDLISGKRSENTTVPNQSTAPLFFSQLTCVFLSFRLFATTIDVFYFYLFPFLVLKSKKLCSRQRSKTISKRLLARLFLSSAWSMTKFFNFFVSVFHFRESYFRSKDESVRTQGV